MGQKSRAISPCLVVCDSWFMLTHYLIKCLCEHQSTKQPIQSNTRKYFDIIEVCHTPCAEIDEGNGLIVACHKAIKEDDSSPWFSMSLRDKQHKKYDKKRDRMVLKKNVSTHANFKKNKDFVKKYQLKYKGIQYRLHDEGCLFHT